MSIEGFHFILREVATKSNVSIKFMPQRIDEQGEVKVTIEGSESNIRKFNDNYLLAMQNVRRIKKMGN